VRIYRALLENMASFYGSQMSAMDRCDAQRRRHDQETDAEIQSHASGDDHKELIEIISGAEAL